MLGATLLTALVILAILLSIQGLWLLCRALWPSRVERAAQRCARRPIISFLVGIPILLAMLALIHWGNLVGGPGQAMSFLVFTAWLFYAGAGTAGFATYIGRRLESPIDELQPWRATLRGGIALNLAYLVPLIGQVFILPCSFVIGTGAMTLTFFQRRRSSDALHASIGAESGLGGRMGGTMSDPLRQPPPLDEVLP